MSTGDPLSISNAHDDYQYQMQQAIAQAEIAKLHAQISQWDKPFDETSEFKDFVIWLCGYTDREEPPSKKEWRALQKRAKKMAAGFAARSLKGEVEPEWRQPTLLTDYSTSYDPPFTTTTAASYSK
jgi:hypothetical protein